MIEEKTIYTKSELEKKVLAGEDIDFSKTAVSRINLLTMILGNANFAYSKVTNLRNLTTIGKNADFRKSKVTDLGELTSIGNTAVFCDSKITNLGKLTHIGQDAHFEDSVVTDLGELEYIGLDAFFKNSQITDLGKLTYIGRDAHFNDSKITSLGELKTIGGDADLSSSKVTDLRNLISIGGDADLSGSKVTDLGELTSIGKKAVFADSEIISLGKLTTIGGDASFEKSNVVDLGELTTIGGDAEFSRSGITSLGKLTSVGGYVNFRGNKIADLGELTKIGGQAYFQNSKITDLKNLTTIGGYAIFKNSEVTDLGKLVEIGGDAHFENSKITDLGELATIGGDADFSYSQVNDLGELKTIDGSAYFKDSLITDLGELATIGGNADFSGSIVTDLGKLTTIGSNAHFEDSEVTDLGELEYIGLDAHFEDSKVTDLGKLTEIDGYVNFENSKITDLKNLTKIGGNANFENSEVTDLRELISIGRKAYFKNSKIESLGKLESIGKIEIDKVRSLVSLVELDDNYILTKLKTDKYSEDFELMQDLDNTWRILSNDNSSTFSKEDYAPLISRMLSNDDYLTQNLEVMINLVENETLKTKDDVKTVVELMDSIGGFITPVLTKKYVQAKDKSEKEKIIKSYNQVMAQVLSSSKIDVNDKELVSEAIFLAYRPTGYTLERVQSMIENELEDLTHQLDKIKFKPEGYVMNFNLAKMVQEQDFDIESLANSDIKRVKGNLETKRKIKKEAIQHALSEKPKHKDALFNLFNYILDRLVDDRVVEYNEEYNPSENKEYNIQRLESLSEILGIIPKEERFYDTLREMINGCDYFKNIVQRNADKYQWHKNKKDFSKAEVAEKKTLDKKILNGEGDVEALTKTMREKFLRYGDETAVDVYYNSLLKEAKKHNKIVKKEIKKVKRVRSDEQTRISAVISKNVGSYFAKAGAELCTKDNVEMWNEERHVHLNLTYNNQIIGNVMLYFEPERDYMIARGFNPRIDTMDQFDRYSMATEMVGVLENIAKENGYKEIFIPEQTGWHALSNRDGMAKEIKGISRKNIRKVQRENPEQRTHIEDADFYLAETGGTSTNNLNLLSLVQ